MLKKYPPISVANDDEFEKNDNRWLTNYREFISKTNSLKFSYLLKGNAAYFIKKIYIIDENDSLFEYNQIPLGHNRTNGAVYSKIYFKVEICSAC